MMVSRIFIEAIIDRESEVLAVFGSRVVHVVPDASSGVVRFSGA